MSYELEGREVLRDYESETCMDYKWHKELPNEDGEFFYQGLLPKSNETIVGIVSVSKDPTTQLRFAYIFIPLGWRGDKNRKASTLHFGELHEWSGKWAGPEFGLCCVDNIGR